MDKNRADVLICGSSYVLSSDKSEERIKTIAKYVDEELRHTSRVLNVNPNYKAAILASLNIAETLMDTSDKLIHLQSDYLQLENDVKHYSSLLEQSKKQIAELKDKISADADRQIQSSEDQKKLKEKLTELESAYFDLQKENVSLRNAIKSVNRMNTSDEF